MGLLVAGLLIFFVIHLVPSYQNLRHRLIGGMGEMLYKVLFSAASLLGLYLIAVGYGEARLVAPELFDPPAWTRHVAMLLMLIAFVMLAAAYIPSRIRDAVKHPMLAAVKIWAFAHLIANGDGASLLLFGGFLLWAVYDRISVKRRGAMGPLGDRKGSLGGDVAVVVAGVAAYLLMVLWGHTALIGVPVVSLAVDIPS
jgi:uncharacterized membrane protein